MRVNVQRWTLYVLLLMSGARGNQQNEASIVEDQNKKEDNVNLESASISAHPEIAPASEPIQYKTAEIADAMQATDIPTNPAVLLSMVPREVMDLKVSESESSVCDSTIEEAECSAYEHLNEPADAQDKGNSETPERDTEQAKAEESNNTDSSKPLKVNCEERNITGISNFTVNILNITQVWDLLSRMLGTRGFPDNRSFRHLDLHTLNVLENHDLMEFLNPNSSECTLVLFYTPWCRFSAGLAPHFNTLPRAFPTLHFLALDASQHSSLSTRFGTVAVPNILLFQGAKPMARFNHTDRKLEALKSFIFNQSGIEAVPGVVVTEDDCESPLPCAPTVGIDWLLVFSVIYVTIFIVYATMQTESIRWLIPGQEHEHQE